MRTDIPTQRLSASLLPPEVDPAERDFMRLLEKTLSPSYTLVKRLGAGGMGAVYLARDPVLKRLVAVKVMAPALAADAGARARFEREAQAVASISHPNVVAVYSVGELENGVPYLVMQYIEGRTMAERLAQDGPLEARAAKRVLGEVASALAAAHRKGVIHRDIKPANVLWDDDTGRAMVTDFGIAAVLEREDEREPVKITHTGIAIGTPAYMSPEQLLAEPVTEKSDIYSLGLLGYELFIADGPYAISSPRELMAAHLRDTPRKLSTMRADIDPEVERLLEACLAKDPSQRPIAAVVEKRLSHGASFLLEWPPPGLDQLAVKLRDATRVLLLGGFATGIPLVSVSVFGRETFIRQTLPPSLVILGLTFVGLIVFAAGLALVWRFVRHAQRAMGFGYGWGTIAEVVSDPRGDTGALIAGGREYAELTAETRNALRRNRVVAQACRLLAGVAPVLGFVFGLIVAPSSANGPVVVLWSSIMLAITLLIAAYAITWNEDRLTGPARRRIRTVAVLAEGHHRLAEAWTATFEQVRMGQRFGAGSSRHGRSVSIAAGVAVALAAAAAAGIFFLFSLTSAMAVFARVASPTYGSARAKLAKVRRLEAYRIPFDTTVSALRAGQALHAIVRNGPSDKLERFERSPAISIPTQPRHRIGTDPFETDGGWAKAAFRNARQGFSVAERDYLRALADNSALEEYRMFARAPVLDFAGTYWELDANPPPAWFELPIPALTPLRQVAHANAAQAALAFSAGRADEAERRLRENISAGLLLMDQAPVLLMNLVGSNMVASACQSLTAFYDAIGRPKEARLISSEEDPEITIVESAAEQPSIDEISRSLSRTILDQGSPLGTRWELIAGSFAFVPCTDMHQVLFGPDELHKETIAQARASLVRRQSDSLLFAVVDRASDRPAIAVPQRTSVWSAHRPFARIVAALTGNRQLEGCLSLLGVRF
jgi:tRNA A-37 threonylcarbamoyl transferase component Bud32